MSTQLFLRDLASDLGGSGQKALSASRGAASTTAVTNTTASGTNIQVTQTGGGQALTWFSVPLAPVTISGSVTVNIWGFESANAANAKAGVTIEHTDVAGNVLSTIVANTAVPTTSSEYGLSPGGAKNASFTPTSTLVANGDRIKVTLFVKNQGTMGGSQTVTNSYDGPSAAAAGDTYVTFTETLTASVAGPSLAAAAGQPAGILYSLVRTGVAMASLIPAVTVIPPPPPTSGPAFFPLPWPVRARIPANAPRGRTKGSAGAPVRNPSAGPVFHQAVQPCRARIPANTQNTSERVNANLGGPVRNPSSGPLFRQATQPARARLPLQPFLRGRCYSSPGAPLRNPAPGPQFRSKPSPVRYVLPPWQPRAGRIGSSFGAPVINPVRGPTFTPRPYPVAAPGPLPRKGRVYQTAQPAAPVVPPPPTGPVFRQAASPARARLPWPLLRGRAESNPGAPVVNPSHGPAATPAQGPVRARLPQLRPRAGRVASNPGSAPRNPASGPAFVPFRWPVQAADPLPRHGRITGISAGAPPRNPSQGPSFFPVPHPVHAPVPQTFSKGRTSGNPGAPAQNPGHGPAFRQATAPARIRPSLPPRGRAASNPGGPVRNPVPGNTGPVFYPVTRAAARPPLPRRGTCRAVRSYPLTGNPTTGPVFRQATTPVRARIVPPPRGRTGSNPGIPAQAAPPTTGPLFRQATSPARTRPSLPPRGRVYSNPGGPVVNPAPPATGPAFRPAGAIRARLPQPRRGTCRAIRFIYPPVNPPATGPVFRQATAPVRAQVPLHPRAGRVYSNPGGPVVNPPPPVVSQLSQPAGLRVVFLAAGRTQSTPAPAAARPAPTTGPVFRQAASPARIRPALPPRGRTAGNPGGPVRNPGHGPVFRQAVRPDRAVIPQNAPRGRTASNPGGPVENIPFRQITLAAGQPFTCWETEVPFTDWVTGQPATDWQTGVPYA